MRIVSDHDDLDNLGKGHPFFLFFELPSLDARIVNQGAIMSVMLGPTLVLSELLREHPALYRRITLPKELQWEVRAQRAPDHFPHVTRQTAADMS